MSWVIKADMNTSVMYNADAWVRIWVTTADLESDAQVTVAVDTYKQEVAKIKVTDQTPEAKIKAVEKLREEAVKALEAKEEDLVRAIASNKALEMSADEASIKIEVELKGKPEGHIDWEELLYGNYDPEDELELDI